MSKKIIFIIGTAFLILTGLLIIPWLNKSSDIKESLLPDTKITKDTGQYAYKNTTNNFTTHFKDKPTEKNSIAFANNLGKISFYTPKAQSFGELNQNTTPISKGSTLIYPNIFPQVDLLYTISTSRLLEEFIVKDKDTANKVTRIKQIAVTSNKYQENPDGSFTFQDNKGKTAFTLPAPVLYEKEDTTKRSTGIKYEIQKDNNNQITITKVITPEGLDWLNNKTRTYPIVIDLVIDTADTAASWVSSDTTNTVVSQETSLKMEGTGSVKVQTTTGISSTIDLMEYSSDANAQAAFASNTFTATGGTETTSGIYRVHTYLSGTSSFTPSTSGNVEALVVGGGGGGGASSGASAGGGGGGGLVYNSSFAVTAGAKTVTVGDGGPGGTINTTNSGTKGTDSVFSTITATGGGAGGGGGKAGGAGGSGGGGGTNAGAGGSGTSGQGYAGGTAQTNGAFNSGGGGGAGGVGAGSGSTGNGGVGVSSSISGSSLYYSGGGGGSSYTGASSTGGSSIGGIGGAYSLGIEATAGMTNRGGGGGGGKRYSAGSDGGSGIVIIRYPYQTLLSYSEATIKTQGTYSLKGIAKATNSLNQTLTRTIGSPLNLTNNTSVSFDIRSTRTGSNIKVGLHDSGGTTTEITPNITSANAFQTVTIDLSGVSNANKDVIDQIVITIVNADADNTFYIDNFGETNNSYNDTITLTKAATDLTSITQLSFWVRSTVTGSFARFQFGETVSSEQTYNITIDSANTWEKKIWDISGITGSARNAVTKFAFLFTSDTQGAAFYFDDIRQANDSPTIPSLDSPTNAATNQSPLPALKTTATDTESDYLRYKIEFCTNAEMTTGCQTFTQPTTYPQTGWTGQDAETDGSNFTAYASGTQATYTLQSVLDPASTYYWRSYAIDQGGSDSYGSTQASPYSFTTTTAPTAPTIPYAEGTANPTNVLDLTPEFSAIHNDTDGDAANYYEINVNTNNSFTGTVMWNSEAVSMSNLANGARSTNVSYAGTALTFNGATYYWRIRFTDTFGAVGAWSATQNFTLNTVPTTPSLDAPTNTATGIGLFPSLLTTDTDINSDYLRYKIELCTDVGMSTGCQTFTQPTTYPQTGWTGQDAETDGSNFTAYASGTQATYTIQSTLYPATTYYWRSYAIDQGGSNTWSATQTPPRSFTTTPAPAVATSCRIRESLTDSSLTTVWTDNAFDENNYEVQRSVDGGAFSVLATTLAANSVSYQDSTITDGHTYQYRVAPYFTAGPTYATWCTTQTLNLQLGIFSIKGLNLKGLNLH